ncbi:MAG: Ig-like domain-containing protein [Candidatus Methanoperedens sp.]|nr:Ig-like domain-containing protein [Candidatus Methanoperedens sp.]
MNKRITIGLLLLTVIALIGIPQALASDTYPAEFTAQYPNTVNSKLNSCSTCHTSVPTRNPYGAAWRTAGYSFTAIEGADSDGDGYTNIVEINALTFPGDANDFPISNNAPVADNDAYSTNEDTTLSVIAPGVLTNDNDVEGSSLTAVLAAGPSHGALTLNADGSFIYTPTANFNGSDSFTYKANDSTLNSNTATVSITVTAVTQPANHAPVASNDIYSTNEDTSLIAAPGVLGTWLLNGVFTYTPNSNYNGPDSFTYMANDGTANSNVATVSIIVTPVNDPPVAVVDSYTTNENTVLNVAANGVLTNDNDADGNPLTAIKMSDPSHGSLILNSNGSFTYTPVTGYNGSDSFTYKANDSALDSNIAIVSITVKALTPPPPTTEKSKVTFTVTDNRNHPVKEARVSFNGITIKTNNDGKAIFDNVAPGVYSYKVKKEGYTEITNSILVDGDTTISVKLVKSKEREEHEEDDEQEEVSSEHEEEDD